MPLQDTAHAGAKPGFRVDPHFSLCIDPRGIPLRDQSQRVSPGLQGRLTLLLGPPGSGDCFFWRHLPVD